MGNPGGAGVEGIVAEGGAIMNGAGSLTMTKCFISTNQALGGSGGNGGNGAFGGGAAAPPGPTGNPGPVATAVPAARAPSLRRRCLQ